MSEEARSFVAWVTAHQGHLAVSCRQGSYQVRLERLTIPGEPVPYAVLSGEDLVEVIEHMAQSLAGCVLETEWSMRRRVKAPRVWSKQAAGLGPPPMGDRRGRALSRRGARAVGAAVGRGRGRGLRRGW